MAEAAHQRIDRRTTTCLRSVLFQPFPKGCIQRFVLRACDQPRLLDQVFICA